MAARDVASRIRNSYTLPDAGVVLTQTVVLRDLDAPPSPRTKTPGKRVRITWRGPSNVPMFALENCRAPRWTGVDIHVEKPCDVVFLSERTISEADAKRQGMAVPPSTAHRYDDVRIFGNRITKRGVWHHLTVADENQEHMRCDSMMCFGVARPWVSEGFNAKHHRFAACCAESYEVAVTSDTAFHWSDGTIAVGDLAFELTKPGDPVKIETVGVEATKRLLLTSGPTTDAQAVVLDSVCFRADQLHEDGAMIVLRHAGPLTVIGGSYGDGEQRSPHIRLEGIGAQAVNLIGAKFGAFNADITPPVRWNPGVRPTITVAGATYMRAPDASERTTVTNLPSS